MKIRAAVPGDEKAVAELNAFVHKFHVRHKPSYFKPADLKEVTAWFRGLIRKPTVQIWIAEQAGIPVDYASVSRHERPENPFVRARRWLEIDQIGVRPEHQRCGIGRSLVRRIFQAARSENIRYVGLNSWCFNNEAHRAFRRLGFSPRAVHFGRELSGMSK